jgi:calcineurin-like phosphoesterase family protein
MSKTFVMGDVHGAYKALLQCLERSGFNKEEDTLIQLGDVADGWSEVYQCVEELLTIKNLISIKGNHCDWFNDFLLFAIHPTDWQQGGLGTLKSYCYQLDKLYYNKEVGGYITSLLDTDIPQTHRNFFNRQNKYYKDENNNVFVHGGFNRHYLLKDQINNSIFWWDRDLWYSALSHKDVNHTFKIKEDLNKIFIGHTATVSWGTDKPIKAANIWNLDTGAGWKGKLTIMNVDTEEYFQSDEVTELYKNEKGRN